MHLHAANRIKIIFVSFYFLIFTCTAHKPRPKIAMKMKNTRVHITCVTCVKIIDNMHHHIRYGWLYDDMQHMLCTESDRCIICLGNKYLYAPLNSFSNTIFLAMHTSIGYAHRMQII